MSIDCSKMYKTRDGWLVHAVQRLVHLTESYAHKPILAQVETPDGVMAIFYTEKGERYGGTTHCLDLVLHQKKRYQFEVIKETTERATISIMAYDEESAEDDIRHGIEYDDRFSEHEEDWDNDDITVRGINFQGEYDE